jgi:hypothetical protein
MRTLAKAKRKFAMDSKPKPESSAPEAGASNTIDAAVLERIRESLDGLRFGAVTIVVHDGKVVQIERSEKVRL